MANLSVEIIGADRAVGARLADDLRSASSLSVAVAFAKQSALRELDLESWCSEGRSMRLLTGTDFAITELDLLRRLEPRPGAQCRIYHGLTAPNFHPKIYLLDKSSSRVAYIGSSNLTAGGLRTNIEANVRLEGPPDAPEILAAGSYFGQLFNSEFSTPLTVEFEDRYRELQAARREALAGANALVAEQRLRVVERLLVAAHRAQAAVRRWLLVVTPENFDICMRTQTWGHQSEREIQRYQPGDVFFFHINGRGIAAMGMFTGKYYQDDSELWQRMAKGSFPWRIKFVPLGELRTGISTRAILQPLRPGAPARWFNGFIQSSHSLEVADFDALRVGFEAALRVTLGTA